MIEQLLRTPLTELTGVRHPVVQTGMGWVSGPRLVSATANAGGLGILASATMTLSSPGSPWPATGGSRRAWASALATSTTTAGWIW